MSRRISAMVLAAGMAGVARAFDLESLIDPLLSYASEDDNDDDGQVLAEEAGRLLLSFYNTTTTVSASYGLVIILGISFVLLVLLSAVYAAAASLFTLGRRKRSLTNDVDDDDDLDVEYKWARILQLLSQMDDHFRRLGADADADDAGVRRCRRRRLVCQLSAAGHQKQKTLDPHDARLVKLVREMSALYVATDRPELQTAQGDASGLRRAHVQGRNDVDCQAAYPCSSS